MTWLPVLGQPITIPLPPVPRPRPSTGDPVSTRLFRKIQELSERFGALWAECANWTKEYETLMETRVGLAPALFEDPRNLADPALQKAYYEAYRYCDALEAVAAELAQARAQFRAHVGRRALAARLRFGVFPVPGAFSFPIPYY